jgi:hypothetical protein
MITRSNGHIPVFQAVGIGLQMMKMTMTKARIRRTRRVLRKGLATGGKPRMGRGNGTRLSMGRGM